MSLEVSAGSLLGGQGLLNLLDRTDIHLGIDEHAEQIALLKQEAFTVDHQNILSWVELRPD